MKKFLFTIVGVAIGSIAVFLFYYKSNNDQAVIVGQEHRGRIIGYTDADHVFISTDGDSIPEFIAKADEQLFNEIVFQKKTSALNNIEVAVRSFNGSVYKFTEYKLLASNTVFHPVIVNSLAIARKKDKLLVIDRVSNEIDEESSFINKTEVSVAHYNNIPERY